MWLPAATAQDNTNMELSQCTVSIFPVICRTMCTVSSEETQAMSRKSAVFAHRALQQTQQSNFDFYNGSGFSSCMVPLHASILIFSSCICVAIAEKSIRQWQRSPNKLYMLLTEREVRTVEFFFRLENDHHHSTASYKVF